MPARNQDLRIFDVRSLEWYMKHGRLTREEYEKYLASLPDVSDKAVSVEAKLGSTRRTEGQEPAGN